MPFWKLSLGVALGVLVGTILADSIRLYVLDAALNRAIEATIDSVTPGHLPARPNVVVQSYIGPETAKAQSSSRACVDGFMADRDGLRWKPDMRSGDLIPCVASSP